MTIALDATYSVGNNLSGVGLYSREILYGIAAAHPKVRFNFCYRPHRFFRARAETLPSNARRRLLLGPLGPEAARIFHGLNQRLPRSFSYRSIATFHDLFVMTGDYSTPQFRERFTAQARDAAARADAIIAVSAFTKRQVVAFLGVEASRVHVIHHGIRQLAYPDVPRERVILCVGAIQKRKNIARLIAAFRTVDPSWQLVLAGSAGYGADEILRDLPPGVTVTGYITKEQLAEWYRRAMIFAFPSLDEGFGMPVLEAMAAGTPVLTSNRSALPEVVGDAALLVDPEDTESLSEALHNLTHDENLRLDLMRRGKERAARFTWDKAVDQTWQVYRGLL